MCYWYHMKIDIVTTSKEPKEIEKEVDEEIREFERWFIEKLGNSRLVGPERAILKTYLGFRSKLYK